MSKMYITTGMSNIKKCISGSTIKIVAMLCMLIDHIAAGVYSRYIGAHDLANLNVLKDVNAYSVTYLLMRLIGRVAFPIFIFLMIEGFVHTKSKLKYLSRMMLFALVSEIPFDLLFNISRGDALHGRLLEFGYQNVYFTLSLGLLAMICMEHVENTLERTQVRTVLLIAIALLFMFIAWCLKTDYGYVGVLAILVGYIFREQANKLQIIVPVCVVLAISNPIELTAFLAVWLVSCYNGERGINVKWIFYAFYPLHLALIWGVCMFLAV